MKFKATRTTSFYLEIEISAEISFLPFQSILPKSGFLSEGIKHSVMVAEMFLQVEMAEHGLFG
jgi:hypothetical protein